ncbi:MAG: GNAT family N-acetyltransferase [Acidimicrobiales bacterium]
MRTWAPNAHEAATGMLAACEGVARGRTGAWRDSRPGLLALMTTLPGRPYNGIYGLDETATPEDATALVVRLAASGVSWCARLRPSVPDEVDESLRDVGLFAEDEALLMATSLVAYDVEGPEPPELTLNTRRTEDDLAIAEVLGAAFGALPSSAAKLLDPAHLECEGIQWHLGKVDGVPVTCAMSVVAGDAVGIFAVGTVPEARGKGYGSAVTSRALTYGFAAGAGFGVLTASPEVQGVYERLGFSVMERWRRLVPSL